MRIDSAPVARQQGITLSAGAAESRVKVGDIVQCEVLAKENGVLKLQTSDGGIIKARLDDGIILNEGDSVKLAVVGKKDGIVYLSTDLDKAALAEQKGDAVAPRAADTIDGRITERLGQLNIPVREELVGRVRDLIAANPAMTMDEAVFLASNKIAADSPMMGPMLSLLNDGAKLDKLITSLLSALQSPGGDAAAPEQSGGALTLNLTHGAVPQAPQAPPGGSVMLADWVNSVLRGAGEQTAAGEPTVQSAAIIVETGEAAEPTARQAAGADTAINNTAVKGEALPERTAGSAVPEIRNSVAETGKISPEPIIPQSNIEMHEKNTQNVGKTGERQLAELLSKLPEFKGTPPEAIERFSSALARAAADGAESAAKWPDDVNRFTELIGKMFARPSEGGGEQLKQIKDELFVRLTMLEEEISRSRIPARETAAAEVQKLIEHVRALQNVEQYVYMQLPIRMGEDNKAAELYVFRNRKGGKQFDPDNVNILLSVDLTHLGHWESLVNIRGRDVLLRMEVQSAEAKSFFSDNTVRLHSLLDEAGFRLTEASISYSEEETNPLTALSSLLRFKTGNNPRIDLAV